MSERKPVLSFNKATGNKATGCYEGTLLVQVDAEIFRRLLLKAVEEDDASDLTDPQTWLGAVARVGEITQWIGKPHVKVTPVSTVEASAATEVFAHVKQNVHPFHRHSRSEVRLREQVRGVAPHLWDEQCLTPCSTERPRKERQHVWNTRHRERRILAMLYEEWQRGEFVLDADAAEHQREYQELQQTGLLSKLEPIASAVNGNRFHWRMRGRGL